MVAIKVMLLKVGGSDALQKILMGWSACPGYNCINNYLLCTYSLDRPLYVVNVLITIGINQ